MWSSKPAFAISPKSQINNGKICSSLSQRISYAATTCLRLSRLVQLGSPVLSWCSGQFMWHLRRRWLWCSLSLWGRGQQEEKWSLKESSALFHCGEITQCMNANEASISCRVNSSFISMSFAGFWFPVQYRDLILCFLHNYREQCCVFPKAKFAGNLGQPSRYCVFGLGGEHLSWARRTTEAV